MSELFDDIHAYDGLFAAADEPDDADAEFCRYWGLEHATTFEVGIVILRSLAYQKELACKRQLHWSPSQRYATYCSRFVLLNTDMDWNVDLRHG